MAEVKFVVFKLGKEEYGINIMQVQEIVPYEEPVKVPNAPAFVEGVMNLRGNVIPVISLKKRFGIPVQEINDNTRLIVINVGSKPIAFIVDDASEVLTLNEADIQETPEVISNAGRKYVAGIGKHGDRLIIILDLDYLLSDKEYAQLDAIEM